MTYLKTLNQIQVKQEEVTPAYIKEIPEEPNEEQTEMVKQKMIEQFQDIIKTLRPMSCIPGEINEVPEATPVRISTTGR